MGENIGLDCVDVTKFRVGSLGDIVDKILAAFPRWIARHESLVRHQKMLEVALRGQVY